MRLRTALHLAVAETRRSRSTLLFCVLSIALGVMALTAGRTLTDSLEAALSGQARQVLGADLVLSSNQPLSDGAAASLSDALRGAGAASAEGTRFYSMISKPGGGTGRQTQFVRVRAVDTLFPFYGHIETEPPGRWQQLSSGGLLLDPSAMRSLSLNPGDEVQLGQLRTRVLGAVKKTAGSPTAEFSMAPMLYVHQNQLEATGLVKTGSRIQHARLFRLPAGVSAEAWKANNWSAALEANLDVKTSKDAASSVRRFFSRLSKFLTVVGLITLFLSALGIGSAMNSFMTSRLNHAVILRCLGASARDLLAVYALVAALIAITGSVLGALLGAALPVLLKGGLNALAAGLLPADIPILLSPSAMLGGAVAGIAASLGFMLAPVWRATGVSPLRVLGRDLPANEKMASRAKLFGAAAIAAVAFTLSSSQTDSLTTGLGFTTVIALALLLLASASRLLVSVAKKTAPKMRSFHLRQGLANLHRPENQTASVTVAVGMGFLLISSILSLQYSLEGMLEIEAQEKTPNLFVVDVQPEQWSSVHASLDKRQARRVHTSPMISARIRSIAGRAIDKSVVNKDAVERSWNDRMRTREYFVSYRDHLIEGEQVVEGTLWQGRPKTQEVSLSADLAKNLGAKLGDTLGLSIEGLPLEARVTSLRKIQWEKMRENVMILLSPGEIEAAPHMVVATARIENPDDRFSFQAEVAAAHPNITVVDVTQATQTARMILSRVSVAFRAVGLLGVLTGVLILGGAIAAGRLARRREAMLLKVLGASRADLVRILITEYLSLSLLGTLAGWLLLEIIARAGIPLAFDTPVRIPYPSVAAVAVASVALNTLMGWLVSRQVSAEKPLEVLRED